MVDGGAVVGGLVVGVVVGAVVGAAVGVGVGLCVAGEEGGCTGVASAPELESVGLEVVVGVDAVFDGAVAVEPGDAGEPGEPVPSADTTNQRFSIP